MTAAKVARVETLAYRMPFSTFLRSGLQMHVKQAENVLVRLTCDDGTTGVAEANAFAELFGESQASIQAAIAEWIVPRIRGIALTDVERLWQQLDIVANNNSAKAAIDMAVQEALAKRAGLPLWRHLGGFRDRVKLTWIIGQGSIEEMVEEGQEAKARGFASFKIKIGLDPRKDVKAVAKLREALGDDTHLYVDANQAYSFADAVRYLPAMEDEGITLVEDPMPNADTAGRASLARRLKVPLLGDECVRTPQEMMGEIELGALRAFNVKPPRSGYTQTKKILALAEQAGLAAMMGTMLETDIGVLGAAHFAAAHRVFATYPAELTYFLKMKDRLLSAPLAVKDGVLVLPDGPGLGIEIDEDKIKRYRVEA
ncbi:MAG: hypothetical protein JNK11_10000 [Alphaproteobacteria bacterium]|nr:hypothetical protein [Alphaproteobacteria bacterium]